MVENHSRERYDEALVKTKMQFCRWYNLISLEWMEQHVVSASALVKCQKFSQFFRLSSCAPHWISTIVFLLPYTRLCWHQRSFVLGTRKVSKWKKNSTTIHNWPWRLTGVSFVMAVSIFQTGGGGWNSWFKLTCWRSSDSHWTGRTGCVFALF